jgi:Spirocyclase AveC-like
MSITVDRPILASSRETVPDVEERRLRPVMAWALGGALCLALQAYVYIAWIAGSNFKSTSTGVDRVPGYMKTLIDAQLPIGLVALVCFTWFFLIKPWRRDGRPSFDGMMVIGWTSIYWMDGMGNYFAPMFTYNSYVPNMGSWYSNVPGWFSPNGHKLAEPPLMTIPLYVYGFMAGVFFCCWVMRHAKARWPRTGKFGMAMIAWATMMVFDFVAETIWMRTGYYAWPGAIKGLTLWYGKWYQFPIYESVIWGAGWAGFALWRFYRNDRGESLVERGLDRVKASTGRKNALRILATIGMCHALFLIYYIPIQYFGLKSSAPPAAFMHRSYFLDGICGPGTNQACPGPKVPIAHRGSAHLRPDGTLAPAT